MNGRLIPYHVPIIGEEEIAEVMATLRSGWLTTGPRTHQFEQDFREYTGAKHSLALNSGTAALHLALAALDIGPTDEVITTPLTFCATVNSIMHMGATPVLADIGEDGNIDPVSILERMTPRTRAILPVHYAGQACDMDAIWRIARVFNLKVVEDAAHASGTYYRDAHVGSATGSKSDAVAFSFYATKNLTTAEGGMVTTSDGDLNERMRRLSLHGINKDAWNRYSSNGKWFYSVEEPGFKYNLTDIASAIGIHQLRKLEWFIDARTRLAALYNRLFADVTEVETPAAHTYGRHSWHLYVLRLNLEMLDIRRDEFIEELKKEGVGVSVHFIPIPLHPFYAPWVNDQSCPRALALYERIVSLPLYPGLTPEDVHEVVDRVKNVISAHRRIETSKRLSAVALVQ
jgi:dTDP-4-amino-4,6-dideoxygalactose transaminase